MAYDASAYGGWVGGGDWRAWVGVTKGTETATSCQYTVSAWMCAGSGGSSSYASNIQGWAGIWDEANGYRWTGAHDVGSFSPGDEWEFRSQTWTVSKSHSAQTVYFYSDVQASAGIYSGSESKATCTLSLPAKTSYRVTYDANGGSGAPSAQTKWHGESLTLSSTKPTRTGYTFKGWATSRSATTATYAAGASYTGNAALPLYAVWQAVTYAVTFNANGGSGAPSSQTKTYGVALSLNGWGSTSTTDAPTRTGYTFQGWSTSSSATSATYTSSSHSYTDNKTVTLYAVWKANTYQVAYNANGGSGTVQSQTKTYNVALTLRSNSFTRAGYAFKGWATSAKGSVAYAAGASYTTNAAVTLYAVWQAQAPTLTISRAYRAKLTGAADDEGTYVRVFAKWSQAVSGSVTLSASLTSGGSTRTASTTASGTSGTADLLIDTGDTLDGGTAYTVTVTATNSAGTTTKTYRLGTAMWPIDVLKGGLGVAIGKAATLLRTLDVGWTLRLAGALQQHASALGDTKIGVDVPSSAVYGANHAAYDAAGRNIFYSQFGRTAGDALYRSFVVQRKDANDATIQNGFYVGINANGEPYINFAGDGRQAWLDGLGVGTVVENEISTAVSVASGSWKTVGSFTLPAGVWVLQFNVIFASNATGRRAVTISGTQDSAGSATEQRHFIASQQATNGMGTGMGHTSVYKTNGNTTAHLNVLQNSGSALNVTGFMRAVRIG